MDYLIGHPFALIKNSIIFQIVYMGTHDPEVIKEKLSYYEYESFIDCSEYGRDLSIGDVLLEDGFVVPRKPEGVPLSFIFDREMWGWRPPIHAPGVLDFSDKNTYIWNEENQVWDKVSTSCCQDTTESSSVDLSSVGA